MDNVQVSGGVICSGRLVVKKKKKKKKKEGGRDVKIPLCKYITR